MADKTPYPAPLRRYLPADFSADSWQALEPIYRELEQRNIQSREDLEKWLFDRSEVDSWVAGESSRRNVRSSSRTDDAEAERLHLEYQTVVFPQVKTVSDRLDRLYLESPFRRELDPKVWAVFDRETKLAVELFREENVALEAEEETLIVDYGRITGAMTVELRGDTYTLAGLSKFLEATDRQEREEAWRAAATRRLQDCQELDGLFDRMLSLRVRIARNAGFDNYRDYKHLEQGRLDYDPHDCIALHENVERYVLPLMQRMEEWRCQCLRLDRLRPWDMSVDPTGRPPFEPFTDSVGHVRIAAELMEKINPNFGDDLRWMARNDLLDLDTRPHKRQGGFMDTFEDTRVPFIFANSGTTHGDVETLVHEGGHAIHALLSRDLEPLNYRNPPLEFAEVASMAMECMAWNHYDAIYPRIEARRAILDSLESVVRGLAWIATVDAFQHWIYTRPDHDIEQRSRFWVELRNRFSPGIDWTGLEKERAFGWHGQLHIFEVPFYYIEYALAQIGALQIWQNYRRDPVACVANYQAGLACGGAKPLPDLFAAAGVRFDARGETLGELMNEIEVFWDHYKDQPVMTP